MTTHSPAAFFAEPNNPLQRRYEVLRAFFREGLTSQAIAERFGYTVGPVFAMTRGTARWPEPAAWLKNLI